MLPVRDRTQATCRQPVTRQHFAINSPTTHQPTTKHQAPTTCEHPVNDPPTTAHRRHETNPVTVVESFRDVLTNQRAARGIPSSEAVPPGGPGGPLVCPNPIAKPQTVCQEMTPQRRHRTGRPPNRSLHLRPARQSPLPCPAQGRSKSRSMAVASAASSASLNTPAANFTNTRPRASRVINACRPAVP